MDPSSDPSAAATAAAAVIAAPAKDAPQTIPTNKDRVLTIAVQGRIAPAQPARGYSVTWDGKPKLAIGTGGINYNLKIGDRVFGWARGVGGQVVEG